MGRFRAGENEDGACGMVRMGRTGQDRIASFDLETGEGSAKCLAVFDGHGQEFIAAYLEKYLPEMLNEKMKKVRFSSPREVQENIAQAFEYFDRKIHDLLMMAWLTENYSELENLYVYLDLESRLDINYLKRYREAAQSEVFLPPGLSTEKALREVRDWFFSFHGGSTAVLAMWREGVLYMVNLGDSKGVYFDRGCLEYTEDHKPETPSERERIYRNGGFVCMGRVGGTLALSRAFGDFVLKQIDGEYHPFGPVSVMPDVYVYEVSEGGCLLLGTDGLFDVLSPEEIYQMLNAWTRGDLSRSGEFCKKLLDVALQKYAELDHPIHEIDDISFWLSKI